MKKLGERYQATSGQVALAWLLAQGDDVIPIPGTTKIAVSNDYTVSAPSQLTPSSQRLEENLGALKVQLSDADLQEVRTAAEKTGFTTGSRLPPAIAKFLFVDTPELEV